ncbi:unnamed protein product [Moneuplotes crassus]|uniref:Glucose-6-phosphate isomerase n=2 Tax=Euplotes crassus TaxID=5936 RepID=A0AAD1X3M1_EUPCR|nr:unnamed protein product [Moneuplotes crassus]
MESSSARENLQKVHDEAIASTHLKTLLSDDERNSKLVAEHGDITLDYTHTKIDSQTLEALVDFANESGLKAKIDSMFKGDKINSTEKRSVLHAALRMARDQTVEVDGKNLVELVWEVRDQIQAFSQKIREGDFKGYSGKLLKNVVVIGIGGSYLGPEFVYEALRYDSTCNQAAEGRNLRFLANVDPTDFSRSMEGLDIEETVFIINSKTFTTAETMLNARTVSASIVDHYRASHPDVEKSEFIKHHVIAGSTNISATKEFGIAEENVFGFWDWVGGRYSVCSAIGVLPLSIHYGYENVSNFLDGAKSIDDHFRDTEDLTQNLPVLLGMLGYYNTSVCNHAARALLPYSQALLRFPAHIQQVDMESNGKSVTKEGERVTSPCGPIVFGEPGTNGQHSFYQLMHQGRIIPAEFIGFIESQTPIDRDDEVVSNHDELMSNFFAQPDALALGKDLDQLKDEGVPEELQQHKLFEGDRPSLSILFKKLDAFSCGQLLSLYEHRIAVEGFLYNVNSFDQWGVELGKVLAKDVRKVFHTQKKEKKEADLSKFNSATASLLKKYLG